ncbi:ATP-dependent protease [Burkholderia stabilis]|nr:ATP-dependent protease [Burkholderia stabilis]
MTNMRDGMATTFDEATTAAIAAFAQLDFYTAVQAMRAEADYDRERDQWISRYIDEHGGGADDAAYDALHAQAQATPEYAQFIDAVRREILEYFGVTDNQLDWMVLLRNDDSDELWAEVNQRRSALGTGEVRGDL